MEPACVLKIASIAEVGESALTRTEVTRRDESEGRAYDPGCHHLLLRYA
jgi:hypothetical protein